MPQICSIFRRSMAYTKAMGVMLKRIMWILVRPTDYAFSEHLFYVLLSEDLPLLSGP